MVALRLQWLGPPQVWCGEQLLSFKTRKAFAVLAYLATAGSLPTGEHLAALPWPENDAENARGNLRTTIAHRRRARGAAETVLAVTRETIGLCAGAPLTLDVQMLAQVQRLVRAGEGAPGLRRERERAVAAYRGPFLAGVNLPDVPELEGWVPLAALGMEPCGGTVALAARVNALTSPGIAVRGSVPDPLHVTLSETPLVNRAREIARLRQAYARAQARQAQVVVLEAEAGIGKTRLAGVLLAWAHEQGTDVLRGASSRPRAGYPTRRWWRRCGAGWSGRTPRGLTRGCLAGGAGAAAARAAHALPRPAVHHGRPSAGTGTAVRAGGAAGRRTGGASARGPPATSCSVGTRRS